MNKIIIEGAGQKKNIFNLIYKIRLSLILFQATFDIDKKLD